MFEDGGSRNLRIGARGVENLFLDEVIHPGNLIGNRRQVPPPSLMDQVLYRKSSEVNSVFSYLFRALILMLCHMYESTGEALACLSKQYDVTPGICKIVDSALQWS